MFTSIIGAAAVLAGAVAGVVAGAGAVGAQDRPRRPASHMQEAIAVLTEEAEQARRTHTISDRPDFALRFERDLDLADVRRTILGRAHRDPFIDAYIRWQLTSFRPELTPLDGRDLGRLLREAPAMVENPRAASDVMDLMRRAADAGQLSPADRELLRALVAELDERSSIAEQMNMPAVQFREWVHLRLSSGGSAPLQWLIENCAATIDAGWPPRAIKGRMTAAFSAAGIDESITDADRAALTELLYAMVGRERRSVNRVTFLADGSVRVSYATAQVTRRDVENWVERLAGITR
jgi:hypothetical protein